MLGTVKAGPSRKPSGDITSTSPTDAGPTLLARSTTGEELAAILRERIMQGSLPPGTPLREVGLAKEFGVSRRTVQDAIAVLLVERLVRHERHRGARVAELTKGDIEDLYFVRLELELMAARSAGQASPAAKNELQQAYDDLKAATAARRSYEIVNRDLDFHRAIVGLLGSPRIGEFFSAIASELRYALAIHESVAQEAKTRPRAALEEHAEILEALLAPGRGSQRATRLLTEHIAATKDRLIEGTDRSSIGPDA